MVAIGSVGSAVLVQKEKGSVALQIGNVSIGAGHRCAIVAELSNAANGDYDRMRRLMVAARDAGADLLKVQAYTVAELVALRGNGPAPAPWNDRTMAELYTQAQTPLAWMPGIFTYAQQLGIPVFSSVFGATSLACLEAVGCPAYKISHFEWDNRALKTMVGATGKPLVISAPFHSIQEGQVYCPGGYPARTMDLGYSARIWGFSSHCLHPLVAPLAVGAGARYLEYHMMLHDEPSILEANVSLDEYQFHDMVQAVRQAEVLLG